MQVCEGRRVETLGINRYWEDVQTVTGSGIIGGRKQLGLDL